MRNLILRSVLIALVLIPIIAAREPHPRRAVRKAILLFVGANVLYMLALRFLYPVLS